MQKEQHNGQKVDCVIVDEAHRTQYGFKAKINKKTSDIKYGFAKYLRDALPNATYIAFTGTPIEKTDRNTPAVFGNYIDIYDIAHAVEDGVTVPISVKPKPKPIKPFIIVPFLSNPAPNPTGFTKFLLKIFWLNFLSIIKW